MVLTTACTVMLVIRAGFRHLSEPDHRKYEDSIVTRVMQPDNHIRRHD
jgi:hypothetical protein